MFRKIVVLTIVILLGVVVSSSAASAQVSPVLVASPNHDWVDGYDWPESVTIYLYIDDDANLGNGSLFSVSGEIGAGEHWINFELREVFNIQAGHHVTMTDGTTTKILLVSNLVVTNVNPDTDTVSGTADSGSEVHVWIEGCVTCDVRVTADSGTWLVDFPDGALVPGTWYPAEQEEEDGDRTQVPWLVPDPPEPGFAVIMSHNEVHAYDWPLGSDVTLEIDDPSNGPGVDYADVQPSIITSWDPNQTWSLFQLGDAFTLMPGHEVTVSDGITPKSHTVTHLMLDGVDPDTDDVYGTATPDTRVQVWIGEDPGANIEAVADGVTGMWSVDFTGIYDFGSGNSIYASQHDNDGDATRFDYYIPNPFFEANLTGNWIAANEFPAFSELTIRIHADETSGDLLFTASQTADEGGHAWFDLWELGFDSLQPWNYVHVTGDGLMKDLVLLPLTMDVFDPGTGEISGTAPNGETVRVDACNEIITDVEWDCRSMEDVVEAGMWSVTFTKFLNPDTWSAAFITDGDGDSTMAEPMQPEPPPEFGMDTWSVALGDLDADGDLDAFVGNTGYNQVWFNEGDAFFYDSGQLIGDADTWAVALEDLDGDGDLDVFVGNTAGEASGGPGAENMIWLNDGNGNFTDTEQRLGDSASEAVALGDIDGDGDADAFVANTAEQGHANTVWLNDGGGGFTLFQSLGDSASFGVALGDLDADGDLDAFVGNMGDNKVWFNSGGGHFVDSGQAFGPAQARELVLDDFDGDGDLDAFVVSHFSQGMNVWLNDGSGNFTNGQNLSNPDTVSLAMADLDGDSDTDAFIGNFDVSNQIYLNDGSAQFADSGAYLDDGDHSEAVALGDLDGDGDVDAFVGNSFGQPNKVWLNDGSGHFTDTGQRMNGWVPTPYLVAAPIHDWIDAWGWELGEILELTIDDPETDESPDYTASEEVVIPDWDPNAVVAMFEFGGEFNLRRGHFITVSGSGIDKTHEVIHLYVDAIDLVNDTISGTGVASREVMLWVHDVDDSERVVQADGDGYWSVVYDIVDLEIGNNGQVAQADEDGDETWIFWEVLNPRIQAWPEIEFVEGFDWPDQALIDLAIEDPLDGVLFTDTQIAGPAEWDENTIWVGFELPEGFDLMPGHIVSMSHGAISKVHQVTDVAVTGADIEADTVFGTASTGSEVLVIPHEDWEAQLRVPIDPPGEWTAYFAGIYDMALGTGYGVAQEDDDGDGTWVDWWVPMHIIEVFDGVKVFDATPNSSVTITIYDSQEELVFGPESRQSDDQGNLDSHYTTLGCHFMLPGDFVVVTDDANGLTKTLLVRELQIENIYADTDIITGQAEPGARFILHVDDVFGGFEMEVFADVVGNWTADFGSQGYDIPPAALAHAWLNDEDQDVTMHRLPNNNSPDYVRVLPFLDGKVYTVCPGQSAKIYWGWMEQSEEAIELFWTAVDEHSYTLDEVPLFSSTEVTNTHRGPIEQFRPNEFCGWPTSLVSWWEYHIIDLEPGIHSLVTYLSLGQTVPDTCGGNGEVSGILWENLTVFLNVVPGPNDADADGVDDDIDNCPGVPNRDQADFDDDGVGDKCDDDDDNDGMIDSDELIIGTDPFNPDTDGDGVLDGPDNCPLFSNPDQADYDEDGLGDVCDPDDDDDGVLDAGDNCPVAYNPAQVDTDIDGLGDVCDPDDDDDGVLDSDDSCPLEDATGFDADVDGCIDTPEGLLLLINTLEDDVLSDEIKNSLAVKIENAMKSLDKGRENAAIRQLGAFINQVEAQRGKKISDETADLLISYAENLIIQIEGG